MGTWTRDELQPRRHRRFSEVAPGVGAYRRLGRGRHVVNRRRHLVEHITETEV